MVKMLGEMDIFIEYFIFATYSRNFKKNLKYRGNDLCS